LNKHLFLKKTLQHSKQDKAVAMNEKKKHVSSTRFAASWIANKNHIHVVVLMPKLGGGSTNPF